MGQENSVCVCVGGGGSSQNRAPELVGEQLWAEEW